MNFKPTLKKKITAAVSSAAIVMTSIIPELALPVMAMETREDILNSDISGTDTENTAKVPSIDDYDYEMYEYNGHTYAFVRCNIRWNEAKELCESWGGYLAIANDEEENKFFASINEGCYTALGGWDELEEGHWTWVDGSEMEFTSWNGGEPNNGIGMGDQDHLFILGNSVRWDDGFYPSENPFICEWGENIINPGIGKLAEYTLFSGNSTQNFTLNGWKAYFTGNIYTGSNFVSNLSEFYLNGRTDAAGTITANGWKINIPERNENIEAVPMPDLEKAIVSAAGECEYYSESPSYIQDTNIINGSIMSAGDVSINGTNFEGDCYIIADRDITYNVNNLKTTGRIVLYSRNGNITVNGTNIDFSGIIYAPNGKVSFNANETTVNGRVWADTVNLSGSVFNINGSDSDLGLIDSSLVKPEVDLVFDKDSYSAGDDVVVTVTGKNTKGLALEYDEQQVKLDKNNSYTIKAITPGKHTLTAIGWDFKDNVVSSGYEIEIEAGSDYDTTVPELSVVCDRYEIYQGETLPVYIAASDDSGEVDVTVEVDGKAADYDNSGIFSFTSDEYGIHTILVTAADKTGNTAWVSVDIAVNVREEEQDLSAPSVTLTADKDKYSEGDNIIFSVKAEDNVGVTEIECLLNGEPVELSDKGTFTVKNAAAGSYEFTARAYDAAGNYEQKSLTVSVSEKSSDSETGGGSETKEVSVRLIVNNDIYNDNEHNEANIGDNIPVFVEIKNLSDDEIESLTVTVNGKAISLDSDKKAVFIPEKAGEYLFNAVMTAKDGNAVNISYMLYVNDNDGSGSGNNDDDESDLTVKITSHSDCDEITAPADIIGTVKGSGFTKYTLSYAPAGTSDFVEIARGTSEISEDVLGKVDPTLLRNGYYDIKLTGYAEKSNISDIVTVYVTGQMKIGNFSIAFQDMDVNVPGLALTVVRGYDSRDRAVSGDFGYGWNLSVTSAKISSSCKPSKHWSQVQSENGMVTTFKFSETKQHQVSVDWGNGKTDKFSMTVSPSGSLTPITAGITVSYKAQKGTKSTLEPINKTSTELIYTDGELRYYDGTPYEPKGYILTKQDGIKYYFDADGNVTKVTEPNGSTIELTYDGIIHSDGKSIVYNRDGSGRITSIVSPTGKKVEYSYNADGDLTAVRDVLGDVTRFAYEDHYLTKITDPRGVNVSGNIYDDDGRLIKTIDSDGNEIVYDHDIDGRQEVVTDRNGNTTVFVYDDEGNILSQTDANGNTVRNSYDSNGNLDKTVDALGNVTDYGYSESGELLSLTDAEGHTVNNTYNSKGQLTSINAMGINTITVDYDSKGNLTSTTDALGNDIDYTYDTKGQLTSVTDEIGTYMNMTYDSEGNVISATNGAGTTSQFTYDADGNCTSKTLTYTGAEGLKTVTEQYSYDAAGNLVKIIDSEGNVTTTEYNSMGKVYSAKDGKGRITSYDYDDFGNLVKITYPDNTTESFTYDREGNNLTATDRMGRTVSMKYDKVGNLTEKTYPNGAKVNYAYDKNYNLISETAANGAVTTYEYDKIGRNTAIIDALGNRTEFFYNEKSQLENMTDAKGNVYTYIYDDNGNRIKTIYPDGTYVLSSYDARGRVTAQKDQHGYTTKYVYDGADRLVRVTNAQNISTNYSYDEVGNMISVTDGNGNVTSYEYDDFGRVVRTTNALGNSAYTTYDISGNVLTSTDYAGNVTTYEYDRLDRLTGKTNNDGTVNYTYTADGKIKAVKDENGVTSFVYDDMDGLTKVSYPDGTYVKYSYDDSCRLTKVTTPFGSTSYEYDLLDRIVRVVDRNGYATTYEYDANGNRTAVHYANGLTTTYNYDELNRLIRQETVDSDSNVVVQYIYTLGAAGERLKVTELDRTVKYSYDNLYRLVSEKITEDGKTTLYSYAHDAVSNRTLKSVNGEETVYTYNALNQLETENDITYEYDLNGNAVRAVSSSKSALYTYNADNKLIRATVQSGNNVSVEEYKYDYAGNRTAKISEGEYTKYLLDVNGSLTYVLAELDYNGKEKCYYTRADELISQERNGKISYYVYDGHGSVRALTDDDGDVTDRYVFDAFGNLISSYGSTKNDFLFAGEQFDPVTGLYYLRARYMNPSVGTFISMDTYEGSIDDPVSLHKYLYADANPVTNIDPSGYSTVESEVTEKILVVVIFALPTVGSSAVQAQHDKAVINQGIDIIRTIRIVEPFLTFGSLFSDQIIYVVDSISNGSFTSVTTNKSTALDQISKQLKQLESSFDQSYSKNYVYFGMKNRNGIDTPIYVGITNDLMVRTHKHGKRFDFTIPLNLIPLRRLEAKGVEQVLIERNKPPKGIFTNNINSISPFNPIYPIARSFGVLYLNTNTVYNVYKFLKLVN